MKKLIALVLVLVCVLGLVGCSNNEVKVWDWAQGLNQEDITSATPWSEGSTFEALNDTEILDLVILLNKLTKDSFTENKKLTGGTPTFGIQIVIASETYNINESIHPNGALELKYNEKMWLIDNAELLGFIQKVADSTPTE